MVNGVNILGTDEYIKFRLRILCWYSLFCPHSAMKRNVLIGVLKIQHI